MHVLSLLAGILCLNTVLSRPLPLPLDHDGVIAAREIVPSALDLLEARQSHEALNLFGRSNLPIVQEYSLAHVSDSLQPRAKISAADQATRKAAASAQANVHGNANKPVAPEKQKAAKDKQQAQQAAHKDNVRMPKPNQSIQNGPQKITGQDVTNALKEGAIHNAAGTTANTKGGTQYPHTFNNDPNVGSSGKNKNLDYAGKGGNGRPLDMKGPGQEFPILPGGAYQGGNPQSFRAVTQDGKFKGIVGHDNSTPKPKGDPSKNDLYRVAVPKPKA